MRVTLKIWRQANAESAGAMHGYQLDEISEDMSFLEMLDVLNEDLIAKGDEPIAFDSDCREGICGMCGLMINGKAHGPEVTTTCQLHMRSFSDGDTITIEPWRAAAWDNRAVTESSASSSASAACTTASGLQSKRAIWLSR